jgi:ribonuclease VapC
MTDGVVFDASAVLAVARREPGAERLIGLRDRALLSAVNAAEVYAKLLAAGLSESQVVDGLRAVVRRVVPFDDEQSRLAGAIHAATRSRGLSLGDCACLALGRTRVLPVFTADRAWADLDLGVTVELIR